MSVSIGRRRPNPMPEAFERGGKLAGLMTVFGFGVAVLVAVLEKS